MASWKSYRVTDIITEIDEEKYVLPVIQRELVWSEDKMELLFDSLLKGNSFGGIILKKERIPNRYLHHDHLRKMETLCCLNIMII